MGCMPRMQPRSGRRAFRRTFAVPMRKPNRADVRPLGLRGGGLPDLRAFRTAHRQRRAGRPPSFRIFAVETIPSGKERKYANSERRIRSATGADLRAYERAADEFRNLVAAGSLSAPSAVVPQDGRTDDRLLRYGYADYADLFNARQKLHLAVLADEIMRIEDAAVREAMAISFSDHLKTNNMMCGYAGGWRRLSPLFSIRAYRHIARPVEINPWLEHNGRGTFPNAVRATMRAARSLKESVEPTLAGLVQKVPPHRPETWDIRNGDSRALSHITDESIDLVLTDPPYFDYIAYSELGHFFVPWMVKFGLVDAAHLGRFPEGQLASSGRGKADARLFGERLAQAMGEIARVTKRNGRIAFTYQNLDGRGWDALATAMASTGIVPGLRVPHVRRQRDAPAQARTLDILGYGARVQCRVADRRLRPGLREHRGHGRVRRRMAPQAERRRSRPVGRRPDKPPPRRTIAVRLQGSCLGFIQWPREAAAGCAGGCAPVAHASTMIIAESHRLATVERSPNRVRSQAVSAAVDRPSRRIDMVQRGSTMAPCTPLAPIRSRDTSTASAFGSTRTRSQRSTPRAPGARGTSPATHGSRRRSWRSWRGIPTAAIADLGRPNDGWLL